MPGGPLDTAGTFLHVSNQPLLPGTLLDRYALDPSGPYGALRDAALDALCRTLGVQTNDLLEYVPDEPAT